MNEGNDRKGSVHMINQCSDNQIEPIKDNKIQQIKLINKFKTIIHKKGKKMGNSCSSNCLYDCCDLNYNCATNYNNCYYFYYNYSWIYYTIGSIIFTIIFFVVLCILCRRRQANVMLTQPIQPMVAMSTSQPGYDSTRNMYNGQQNMAYQQGYNFQPNNYQPAYNQQNANYRPPNQPSNQQQGYEMGEPVFLSNNNQPQKL